MLHYIDDVCTMNCCVGEDVTIYMSHVHFNIFDSSQSGFYLIFLFNGMELCACRWFASSIKLNKWHVYFTQTKQQQTTEQRIITD